MQEIIWSQDLDGAWRCEVQRIDHSTGRLTVTSLARPEVILDEDVALSYGAEFGPDAGDVADWQERCVAAVDDFAEQDGE